ncbi:DUF4846 domain-containing protein [bacterium]|nr:DUF4846 domain-containing protein [bacterium]
MRAILAVISFLFLAMPNLNAGEYCWLEHEPTSVLLDQIVSPLGFSREQIKEGSFGSWLRHLPLKPVGAPVYLYPIDQGVLKDRQDVHERVVDIDVLRFQQCADAIIRLWAEYLWSNGRFDEISFRFTSGDHCSWKKWSKGWRPRVQGAHVTWQQSSPPGTGRAIFLQYLDKVMEYAGTSSLSRDFLVIRTEEVTIGDIIVEPGSGTSPGHAVIVLDLARDTRGKRLVLLGQSYMPSQEFHILKNPGSIYSPWFELEFNPFLRTPEWSSFTADHCRRFVSRDQKEQ